MCVFLMHCCVYVHIGLFQLWVTVPCCLHTPLITVYVSTLDSSNWEWQCLAAVTHPSLLCMCPHWTLPTVSGNALLPSHTPCTAGQLIPFPGCCFSSRGYRLLRERLAADWGSSTCEKTYHPSALRLPFHQRIKLSNFLPFACKLMKTVKYPWTSNPLLCLNSVWTEPTQWRNCLCFICQCFCICILQNPQVLDPLSSPSPSPIPHPPSCDDSHWWMVPGAYPIQIQNLWSWQQSWNSNRNTTTKQNDGVVCCVFPGMDDHNKQNDCVVCCVFPGMDDHITNKMTVLSVVCFQEWMTI